METVKLGSNIRSIILKAVEILRSGGVVLYPTDTLYGLGADALSDAAVDNVYAIKGREPGKPMHCIVADLAMAEMYAELNDAARIIAKEFLPGPLTIILKKKSGVSTGIAREIDTIGFRIPKNDFCRELARTFGGPITTPSANLAGAEPELLPEKILAQFGEAANDIDLVVDAGPAARAKPSTVVSLVSGKPVVLREGAIPAAEISALFS